jgi:broad specificity phosphatase PhoE
MKPKRIILIRHGESEGNADKALYEKIPDYKINLTEKGRLQAFEVGQRLKEVLGNETIYAYVSPLYRTRQTFDEMYKTLSQNVVRHIEDPRIRELDWGHFRNPDENEEILRKRKQFSTFYFRIPDGESGADVYDRISTFLETLHRDFSKQDYPENTLIVTHGITLRLFLMRWFHWSVEEFERLKNPKNCQIVIMAQNDKGRYELVSELEKRPDNS